MRGDVCSGLENTFGEEVEEVGSVEKEAGIWGIESLVQYRQATRWKVIKYAWTYMAVAQHATYSPL